MNKRIVYTRRDGGVGILCPSANCIRWMSTGGRWADYPRGFVEVQIERQIAAGRLPDAAARFARAMAFGGCTEAEALAIIRDRDCGHKGTGAELWDVEDVPSDRTYRDAWRRSHNGGPILIDPRKVIQIDEARAWAAYEAGRRAALEAQAGGWRS